MRKLIESCRKYRINV